MDFNNTFPHIAGYNKIKKEAYEIVDMFNNYDLYKQKGARCPRGWLFYGEPGMGKTSIAKDIASNLDCKVIELCASFATENNISIDEMLVKGFAEAKTNGKAIIILDEIDKFAGYDPFRYAIEENLGHQKILLHELDLIKGYDKIIVIATANNPRYLGDTILRSGRFDRHVKFDFPTHADRVAIIQKFIKDFPLYETSVEDLANMTANLSCADIECVVNEAIISAVSNRKENLSLAEFNNAINRVTLKDIAKDVTQTLQELKITAFHEAGHAYMAYRLCKSKSAYATILPQGSSNGHMSLFTGDIEHFSKQDFINRIFVSYAGMVSVKVLCKQDTSGNCGDIEHAYKCIKNMLKEGMLGIDKTFVELDSRTGKEMSSQQKSETSIFMRKLAKKYYKKVTKIIKSAKKSISALAEALLQNKELFGPEIDKIITANSKKVA